MTTDTAHLTFERQFTISQAQLWHLVTDANMREQWGAPSEGTVLKVIKTDFRVGGVERHICGPAEAPEFEVETIWFRIEEPSDAVFTETIEVGGGAIGTSLVTYRIAPSTAGCTLYVSVGLSSFVGADAMGEFEEGWNGGLDNLERLASKSAA